MKPNETYTIVDSDICKRLDSLDHALKQLLAVQASRVTVEPVFDLLTHEKASETLGISPFTLYGITHRREIEFVKRGKRNYYTRQALADFILKTSQTKKEI